MANIRFSRKSGFVPRAVGKRRETQWLAIGPTLTGLASASSAQLFTGFSATSLALRPFTIVRVRGFWTVRSDQNAATENFSSVLALAVVSEQALAIGVTAVPTGDTDRDSDLFFVFEELAGTLFLADATGFQQAQPSKEYDSRAMRKVEEGSDVAFTLENTTQSAGTTIFKSGRILVKLH